MPVQTTLGAHIKFPDGAKVSVKAYGETVYTDIGAISSSVTNTINYTENQITTANFGKTDKQLREMTIEGGFTLINLDYDNIYRLGGGLFTKTTTAAAPNSSIPNQDIAINWEDNRVYELKMYSATGASSKLNMGSTKPTLTSVTLDALGTPEVLAENNDYVVVKSDGVSGWGIQFISAGMTTLTPKTKSITIDYGTNTPVARTILSAGTSTKILTAYAMKIEHTDSNGLIRGVELPSVNTKSGGFNFSFKGANEDGLEEMQITYMAQLDTSLLDGAQLISVYSDENAS
jgi:hypothetical protein